MDTGLIVTGRTQIDNTRILDLINENPYERGSYFYAEWNAREGYFLFPEEPENFDILEGQLEELFTKNNITARFEGQE
jgi:hypothetical protein